MQTRNSHIRMPNEAAIDRLLHNIPDEQNRTEPDHQGLPFLSKTRHKIQEKIPRTKAAMQEQTTHGTLVKIMETGFGHCIAIGNSRQGDITQNVLVPLA